MSMTWIGKARLRLMVIVIGAPLAAFGAISVGPAWLTLPVIGATIYALAMGVNKTSNRVTSSHCWTCGHDLSKLAFDAEHGVACPACGTLNQHLAAHAPDMAVALVEIDRDDSDDDSAGDIAPTA